MRLIETVERLLECPDLNVDSQELETQQAILDVRDALDSLLQCPNCTYIGDDENEFDVLGADEGKLFCPCCHTEFEPES